jgi:hypothetical protein
VPAGPAYAAPSSPDHHNPLLARRAPRRLSAPLLIPDSSAIAISAIGAVKRDLAPLSAALGFSTCLTAPTLALTFRRRAATSLILQEGAATWRVILRPM